MNRFFTLLLAVSCSIGCFSQDWTYRSHDAEFEQEVAYDLASSPIVETEIVNLDNEVRSARLRLEVGRFLNDCQVFGQVSGFGLTSRAGISSVTVFTELNGRYNRREFPAFQKSKGIIVIYGIEDWASDLQQGTRCKVVAYNRYDEQALNMIISLKGSGKSIARVKGDCN